MSSHTNAGPFIFYDTVNIMRIFVTVKPNAKKERVEKIDSPLPRGSGRAGDTHFKVAVKEPPTEGRANWAVERAVGKYFGVPPSSVRIVSGHTSREKVLEIVL